MRNPQAYIDGSVVLENEKYDKPSVGIIYSPGIAKKARQTRQKVKPENRYAYCFIKRAFDVVASFFGLIILSPLFLILAIIIRAESKGKAFFTQTRIGKNGKPFRFYKFRSMCVDAEKKRADLEKLNERDGPVFKIENDPRITRVGKFIRKYSIDELPQLINILRGEMSFVGPRPPLPNEVEQYSDYHMKRLAVKGGLTCYWQISGRKNILFSEWVAMDIKYIQERSLLTDIKIFIKTFKVVLLKKGAF